MKKLALLLLLTAACGPTDPDLARWEQQAQNVTITRDDWGIAHVRGTTDADAVFGLIYAQAEDDFNRVETNFLNAMGRLAEAEGEEAIWRDLRMKLFIHPDSMRAQYAASPEWLRTLMDAWADGLNYYLHTHPEVTPKVLTRFEPWMALTFSEGSIGGDIETINLRELEAFYGNPRSASNMDARFRGHDGPVNNRAVLAEALGDGLPPEPSGSNGFAIAPANSASGHALLWINPHTSFFFRAEAQMTSDEGLNAYGAITWGQFFIYQGFNERAGWMHTSSSVDQIDEYAETIEERNDSLFYRYGTESRPVTVSRITLPFRTDTGMARREVTVYRTHHGPIVRAADGKWIAVRLMEEPVKALTQSWSRTKARNLAEFTETMQLHTNSSNNTVFADAEGNIAYFHANFIPRRDTRFDWTRPVDGSDPATEWGELLAVDESPNVINPANGWIQNTNNAPWSTSGLLSPKPADYPPYVDRGGENPRGVHAVRVLQGQSGFTMETLRAAAFDSHLPAFEPLLPPLLRAWSTLPSSAPLKARLAEPMALLREWDLRWSAESVPTTLAVFWGEELMRRSGQAARRAGMNIYDYMASRVSVSDRLDALASAIEKLETDFGTWQTPWGDINRFQRITGDIVHPFDDNAPSIPVPFTSARWGSLASFGARSYNGSKNIYGTSGNSFVAVVEFGDSVRARAVSAGGQNGDPASPHFNDQAERYASGDLREVYFYPNQLAGHVEREYRPGRGRE